MKKTILSAIVMFMLCSATAQQLIVTTGLSVNSLEKLKSSQPYLDDYPVQLHETQSFPPFLQYGVALRFPLRYEKITLGGNFYTTSTAARSAYQDYSGKLELDQRLRCIGLGFTFTYTFNQFTKSKLNLYVSSGFEYSSLKAEASMSISNSSSKVEAAYEALSSLNEIGVEYQYDLSQKFVLHSSAILHLSEEQMLLNKEDDSEYQYVNWTGIKLLVGIAYKL